MQIQNFRSMLLVVQSNVLKSINTRPSKFRSRAARKIKALAWKAK